MPEITSKNDELLYPQEKITNYPLYFLRIAGKLISLLVFGIGTVILTILCFPVMKLFCRTKLSFRYHTRGLVYTLFNVFIKFMCLLGIVSVKTNKPGYLKNLKSAIVVANHPSYLDSPIMIAQLKHTSIIAKAALSKSGVMTGVINELYMNNSLPYEELLARAKEDLESGNTVMMFPEGTRSTKYGQNKYKKGCARISLATGFPVIPVYIGGTDKLGMGKGDKLFEFNHKWRYVYDLQVKDPVYPDEFKDLPEAIAAKRMIQKVREALSDEANACYRY